MVTGIILVIFIMTIIFNVVNSNPPTVDYFSGISTSIDLVFYQNSMMNINTSNNIIGTGALPVSFTTTYGSLIVYQPSKNDIIFGAIFSDSECYGTLSNALSNEYAIQTISEITSYAEIFVDQEVFWFGNAVEIINDTMFNNTVCATPYVNLRSVFNTYSATIHVVLGDDHGNILVNTYIGPSGFITMEIPMFEGYILSILSTDTNFGAFTLLYESNNIIFSGVFWPYNGNSWSTRILYTPVEYANYRITFDGASLSFTHV